MDVHDERSPTLEQEGAAFAEKLVLTLYLTTIVIVAKVVEDPGAVRPVAS